MNISVAPRIPLTQLDDHDPELMEELLGTVARVARRAGFTGGPEVEAFEEEFSAYTGTAHAVGVASGTDALQLGLRALGIGPGDEVVVPANSFIATAEAVSLPGATPIFADVDVDAQVMTVETVEAALTERVRAIIPVHLFGRTVDLDPIMALAADRGIAVVEDACQAHGALYRGRRVGSIGAFGAFSFYPAKNLGAWGDGGALTTNDPALADHVRLLRSHGERPRYVHRTSGTTARLDALQAAILRIKLRRLEGWNDRRRKVGASLSRALAGTSVIVPAPASADGDHVFHQFVVRSRDRDGLREHLDRHEVASGVHYPFPIHRSGAYAPSVSGDPAPHCTVLATEICSLPIFPSMDQEAIDRVAAVVAAFER